ncbi:MAG TPA: hypothetical protein VN718_09015, partial [Rhizomicrobium sp.]|nr:hypothetical protein [Rhizomicrobium sp.]
MRIVLPLFFALAISAPLASATLAQTVAATEPAPIATQAPAGSAKPVQKTAKAEPAKPKIWEPAVIHAETDDSDADSDGVAAVINDFAVSDYEVRQRLNLF